MEGLMWIEYNTRIIPSLMTIHVTQVSEPPELYKRLLRSDHLSLLYTGLPRRAFWNLSNQLTLDYKNNFQLNARDQVLMTLMKLRLNLLQDDLAERFRVSQSQVSKITSAWYDIMEEKMRCHIPWLPRETIQATLPKCFKEHYPTATCVIDCCDAPLQKPYTFGLRGLHTIRYLVALAPSGMIMFVSAAYGGKNSEKHITKNSDKYITINSGILDLLRPEDVVMVDKGFLISDLLIEQGVQVILPDFTKKWTQQSEEEDNTSSLPLPAPVALLLSDSTSKESSAA
ncbi:hypothetical protein WMY93_006256 [Mugilogobius chulae]|uniref:DDE Tnp4 domain-containing protein n=1 Tax=Mugilogobius chulae TaxID=88201 RepID=A0AAW0PVS9_9GOBI